MRNLITIRRCSKISNQLQWQVNLKESAIKFESSDVDESDLNWTYLLKLRSPFEWFFGMVPTVDLVASLVILLLLNYWWYFSTVISNCHHIVSIEIIFSILPFNAASFSLFMPSLVPFCWHVQIIVRKGECW